MELIEFAKNVIEVEVNGLKRVSNNIGSSFVDAVDLVLSCTGKLIFTGIGKSGHVGKKISSTFSSTGTPSIFLHPAEAMHGDLGLITKNDVVIAISYGGESSELMGILRFCKRVGVPVIGMTGKMNSSLGEHADVVLDVSIELEACPLGLAPTASSTATLALGDSLAMCVLRSKGFTDRDFAERHPSGSLGARLLTRVKDVMHSGEALPLVQRDTTLKEILSVMTKREVRGAAGVIDANDELVGVITDGDIRRYFERGNDDFSVRASDMMTGFPHWIFDTELAEKALHVMESKKVQMLFALNPNTKKLSGIVGIQDLIRFNKQ